MDDLRPLADFERALRGIDFPTHRTTIVGRVQDMRGIDVRVIELAEQLPHRVYDWERDASREFARLLDGTLDVAQLTPIPGWSPLP